MPMKEKILSPPTFRKMATALFESGAGSGLSLGSSAACSRVSRKKQSNAGRSLVDADFIAEMIAAKRQEIGDRWQVTGVRGQVSGFGFSCDLSPVTSRLILRTMCVCGI